MKDPKLEIIRFKEDDVIATSGGTIPVVDPVEPFDPELPPDDF